MGKIWTKKFEQNKTCAKNWSAKIKELNGKNWTAEICNERTLIVRVGGGGGKEQVKQIIQIMLWTSNNVKRNLQIKN